MPGCPPLQPIEKHCAKPQFAVVSVGDNSVVLPVAMHNLSLKASVDPNAQQLPQADWSRMSPETDAQSGQLALTSKDSGMSALTPSSSFSTACGLKASSSDKIVPHNNFTSSKSPNLLGASACQERFKELMWAAISSRELIWPVAMPTTAAAA
jgi:hypothetical protein